MHVRLASSFVLSALCTLGCSSNDHQVTRTFTVALSADQENPRCPDAGPTSTGSATVIVSDTQVMVNDFTWSGLSGPATAAHVHLGALGIAGSIVLTFALNPANGMSKTFVAADYPTMPMPGQPADFAALLPILRDGGTYLNVHTSSCSGGEIRGQIGP
jgi:hypothetical protein